MKKTLRVIPVMLLAILCFSSCACKHKEYDVKTVAPTCTEEGYTEHTCKKCGYSYKDAQTQQVAHPYKSIVISPTCASEGYTENVCTVCGDNYKDTKISKINHTYSQEIIQPTCTAEGYTKHTCTECGDSYNDTTTSKTAHRFNGKPCMYCSMPEITENITPEIEWYSADKTAFIISTPEQLAGLSYLVNSGTTFAGKSVYLDSDIDLGYYEWIPIGNASNSFNGNFSGEGYTVFGLKINATFDYVGLFGNSTGKISNVNITNASIYVKNNYNYVSLVSGYSSAEISDVCVSGFVDAKISHYVAGIVGSTTAVLNRCTSYAEIIGDKYVGGIVGSSTSDIFNCTNIGNIIGKSSYVGGILGNTTSIGDKTLSNLINSGNVEGADFVGGIVGYIYQNTDNKYGNNRYKNDEEKGGNSSWGYAKYHYFCFITSLINLENSGNVTAISGNVGGIAGYIYVNSSYKNSSVEKHCTSGFYTCSITGGWKVTADKLNNTGEVIGANNIAEIIGCFYSDIPSTLANYTVTGKITINGETLEGEYDVGSNTNLTLSGREIYTEENTEVTE